jgi:hypothetical protein
MVPWAVMETEVLSIVCVVVRVGQTMSARLSRQLLFYKRRVNKLYPRRLRKAQQPSF